MRDKEIIEGTEGAAVATISDSQISLALTRGQRLEGLQHFTPEQAVDLAFALARIAGLIDPDGTSARVAGAAGRGT